MRAVQRFGRNIIAYTPTQKLLHWTTAVLVLLQWWTSSAVLRTHQLHPLWQRPDPRDLFLHKLHVYGGLAVLGVVGARLILRWRKGSPQPPLRLSPRVATIAALAHFGLYAVLLGLVFSGLVTTYLWFGMSQFHKGFVMALYGLLMLHVGAIIWHDCVRRLGVIKRMLPASVCRSTAKNGAVAEQFVDE